MPPGAKFRMVLDAAMTVATLALMGGNRFFESTAVHEILGAALLALWAAHVALNRRFFPSLFRGRWNAFRVLQAVANCGILLCAVFLRLGLGLGRLRLGRLGVLVTFLGGEFRHLFLE